MRKGGGGRLKAGDPRERQLHGTSERQPTVEAPRQPPAPGKPPRCQALNAKGKRCAIFSTVNASGFCLWHDPARAAEAAAALQRGRERSAEVTAEKMARRPVRVDDPPPPLELTIPALRLRLAWIHQQLAGGKMDADTARVLTASVREMRTLIERDVDARLRQTEQRCAELQRALARVKAKPWQAV